jgi:hypothetical protein
MATLTLNKYYKDIKIEDMYIDGRVKSRKEIIATNVICKNRLEVSGGYLNLLAHFNLERPTLADKTKNKNIEIIKNVILDTLNNKGKYPTMNDLYAVGITQQFVKHMGGLRNLYVSLGCDDYTNNKKNILEQLGRDRIISDFKSKYIDKAPSLEEVNIDNRNGEFIVSGYMIAKYFGGFENFLVDLGYTPVGNQYGKKCIAIDGHLCDSVSEKIVDDFLFTNNISHEIHIFYDSFTNTKRKFICDFMLFDDTVVEYFGMDRQKSYDDRRKSKLKILLDNNIKCIEIYPKDINKLEEIFKEYIKEVKYE